MSGCKPMTNNECSLPYCWIVSHWRKL